MPFKCKKTALQNKTTS